MKTFLVLLISFVFSFAAYSQNEQAPIVEKSIEYKDWTLPRIDSDSLFNLKSEMSSKRLVLIVYFAPWCRNWRFEAPFVQRMFEKYSERGFGVVGIAEYDSKESVRANILDLGITFPVVQESDSQGKKTETSHYRYRTAVGDSRNWGSPWNIFLEPSGFQSAGDVLVQRAFISSGELMETEAEAFIRGRLGIQ